MNCKWNYTTFTLLYFILISETPSHAVCCAVFIIRAKHISWCESNYRWHHDSDRHQTWQRPTSARNKLAPYGTYGRLYTTDVLPTSKSHDTKAEKIAFKNGRISNFQGLVTLTLTLDRVILHTVMHHSLTSTYIPNFIEIKETICGRTYMRMHLRTDIWHQGPYLQNILRKILSLS